MISLITAISRDNVIGVDNSLPWHRPDDLKNFSRLTTGHTVVMGRKTFESIGHPLKNRANIVVTNNYWQLRKRWYYNPAFYNGGTFDEVLSLVKNINEEVFIIGGQQIYKEFAPYVERMYITVINEFISANGCETTYFSWPALSNSSWRCVEQKMLGPDFFYIFDKVSINGNTQT